MTVIATYLDQLVDVIEQKGTIIRPHLRPGVARSIVQDTLRGYGLQPTETLCDLYAWHDGVDDDPQASVYLFGELQFLPLQEAVKEYQNLNLYYDASLFSIDIAQCFPFAAFQGSLWASYCSPQMVDGLAHPVISIGGGIGPAFAEIDDMARTVLAWFTAGVYDHEPVDEVLVQAIWKQLNPRISILSEPL